MMSTVIGRNNSLQTEGERRPSPNGSQSDYQSAEQIQEMRDLFNMLDKDRDGIITKGDLSGMLASLGLDASSNTVENMLSLMPYRLDFPAFLTYITSQLSVLSHRDELREALTAFDEKDSGFLDYNEFKRDLSQGGPKRLTGEQIDLVLSGFVEKVGKNKGRLSYDRLLDAMMGDQSNQNRKDRTS